MKVYRPPQIPDDEDLSSLVKNYMGNLRRLYIEHPRVRLDGVYIAVCHYTYVLSMNIYVAGVKALLVSTVAAVSASLPGSMYASVYHVNEAKC